MEASGGEAHVGENSKSVINAGVLATISFVAIATLGGYVIDIFCPPRWVAQRFRGAWAISMYVASYAILVPGIISTLFNFDLEMNFGFINLPITRDVNGSPGAISETTVSFIRLLKESGSASGAALVSFYALVIPTLKLILVLLSELLRDCSWSTGNKVGRCCIVVVQSISKWASPDMFAYVLLMYLFRKLSQLELVDGYANLDIGFSCYGVFCICSTVATLAIRLPEDPSAEPGRTAKVPVRGLKRSVVVPVAVVSMAIFLALLGVGMSRPCMELRVNKNALIEPMGPIPDSMSYLLDDVDLDQFMSADVSVWPCLVALAGWAGNDGEMNSAFALFLLGFFAFALSVIHMLVLVAISFMHSDTGARSESQVSPARPSNLAIASNALKHVSMLDVFVMGVIVVCYSARIYEDMGVVVSWRRGLYALLGAEALHYATYYFVTQATESGIDEYSRVKSDEAVVLY